MFGKSNNNVTITVDGNYAPNNFKLKVGKPAKVTFTRVSDAGCTEQVIFNGKLHDLPLNEPVTFEFTPDAKGDFTFTCGMEMAKGTYTVK